MVQGVILSRQCNKAKAPLPAFQNTPLNYVGSMWNFLLNPYITLAKCESCWYCLRHNSYHAYTYTKKNQIDIYMYVPCPEARLAGGWGL